MGPGDCRRGSEDTDLLHKSLGELDPGRPVEDVLQDAIHDQPLKKLVRPDEIGEAVAFLVGPYARSITGQTLIIDSGITTKFALADRWK